MDMKDCTISSESYEKFARSDRSQRSNERVQELIDGGLMSQDAIYRRYTELLSYNQRFSRDDLPRMGNIRQAFRQLRDAETGYLSENRFSLTVAGEFLHIKALDGLALLFDIFSWHAFFPFPELHTDGGVPHIDEDAFIRAVCLLGQNPTPRYAPRFFPAAHDSSTGCWGPHHVWLVTNRGKERSDFLRRLFRSLAVYNGTSVSYRTKILVPRVFLSQPLGGEPNDDGDAEYEHEVVIEKENELSVDIQDTLAECSPDNDDRLTANPLRESYELVLPLLPHHTHDLANLHVPTTKLVTFIHFLQQVQAVEEEPGSTSAELSEEESELDPLSDLIVSAEQLSIEGRLDWGLFDTVMSKDAEFIADSLSDIVEIFRDPLSKICV